MSLFQILVNVLRLDCQELDTKPQKLVFRLPEVLIDLIFKEFQRNVGLISLFQCLTLANNAMKRLQ